MTHISRVVTIATVAIRIGVCDRRNCNPAVRRIERLGLMPLNPSTGTVDNPLNPGIPVSNLTLQQVYRRRLSRLRRGDTRGRDRDVTSRISPISPTLTHISKSLRMPLDSPDVPPDSLSNLSLR